MGGTKKGRALVAMSGGVDSSVAALLLSRAGWDVVGLTMRLYKTPFEGAGRLAKSCCSLEDVDDARQVCRVIGARHLYVNFESQFKRHVIDRFVSEYARGRTPHPCLACNQKLKFEALFEHANLLDCEIIATGHYARLVKRNLLWELLRGIDGHKDQAYALYSLGQKQLQRLRFPVGEYSKTEIRSLARANGLVVADKADSQDICFLPQGGYKQFVGKRLEKVVGGKFVDRNGTRLGGHDGIHRFTVGQRKGLPQSNGKDPLFVTHIDSGTGDITVGARWDASRRVVHASAVSWVDGVVPNQPVRVSARVRYSGADGEAVVRADGSRVVVEFSRPMWAVTPGQAVVFYDGERVLGGGTIDDQQVQVNVHTEDGVSA